MGNTVDKPPQETCEDVEEQQEDDETTFTCEICIEQVNSGQKFKNHNKKCLHRSYCSDCIAKYIEVKLQEYNMSEIKCPGLDCVELLDPLVCQSILPKNVLVRWFDSLCESTVSKYQRVHCPFQECSDLDRDVAPI
ncbi:RBR-type E3 ubiquitin transferase [Ranunculus cassubicifolius]